MNKQRGPKFKAGQIVAMPWGRGEKTEYYRVESSHFDSRHKEIRYKFVGGGSLEPVESVLRALTPAEEKRFAAVQP